MCTVLLPLGGNQIAVNKYITYMHSVVTLLAANITQLYTHHLQQLYMFRMSKVVLLI